MYIEYLPSDALGDIANFSGAVAIGNLWCCGCRLLNEKLMSVDGMRVYDLHSGSELRKHVPRFAYQLRGLKQIFLNVRGCEPAIGSVMLPYDFFELDFGQRQVESISEPSEELVDDWLDRGVPLAVQSCIGRLRALELCAPMYLSDGGIVAGLERLLGSLPSTLTCLSITDPRDHLYCGFDKIKGIQMPALPSSLQELTLGFKRLDLDFIFSLPLRKLCLPQLGEVVYSEKAGQPLAHLERLELPSLGTNGVQSGQDSLLKDYGLFNFLSLLPHIDQLVSSENAFNSRSHPNWSKIRHFSFHGWRTIPATDLFPTSTVSIEIHNMRNPKITPCLLHFHNLTSLDVCEDIRFSEVVFPDTITNLACNWNDLILNELKLLPPSLLRLTRRDSQSVGSIPIEVLPDTLSAIILPEDLGLNARTTINNWKGPNWISTNLALETDDSYAFDTIWSYFKPTSPKLILDFALKAAQRNCQNILEILLSKDTFWAATDAFEKKYRYDFLSVVPISTLSKLYRSGLKWEDLPEHRIVEACKSNCVDFLEEFFSYWKRRTKTNKRLIFNYAIEFKSRTCARWLIDQQLYDYDFVQTAIMSIKKRDIDFLYLLLELVQDHPPKNYLELIGNEYLRMILPVSSKFEYLVDMEYTNRFLDWATSCGVLDSFINTKTATMIIEQYQELLSPLASPFKLRKAEDIFFKMFTCLQSAHFSWATFFQEISLVAKKLGHQSILELLSRMGETLASTENSKSRSDVRV